MNQIEDILLKLYDIGAIKFRPCKPEEPIHIDLRVLIAFPPLLKAVSNAMRSSLPVDVKFDCVGSSDSFASEAIANCVSKLHSKPVIYSKNVVPTEAARCLMVEDLISCGTSALDTAGALNDAKVSVTDVCVFIDRQLGGRAKLEQRGMRVHAVFTIETVLQVLHRHHRIEAATVQKVSDHLQHFNAAPVLASALNAA